MLQQCPLFALPGAGLKLKSVSIERRPSVQDDFAPPVTIPKGASFADTNSRLAARTCPISTTPINSGVGPDKVQKLSNLIAIFEDPPSGKFGEIRGNSGEIRDGKFGTVHSNTISSRANSLLLRLPS
jgi:hypothetical protein